MSPVKIKPFRFHINRVPRVDVPLVKAQEIQRSENLTGMIQGLKASDLEERFSRALDHLKTVRDYSFRKPYFAARNIQGEVELDFDVDAGALLQPVQIDGPYAHHSAEERARDLVKNAILDNALRGSHYPVIRVSTTNPLYNVADLTTQEGADALVRRMFR